MKCTRTKIGDTPVIVCGSRRYREQRCKCDQVATKLCDWIMTRANRETGAKQTTCDEPLCDGCATTPAPDKDLCGKHAESWATHKANRPEAHG